MPTAIPELSRLHDATLLGVSFRWEAAEARVKLRLSGEPSREAAITVRGSTSLRCPREEPWGPSVSINEVRVVAVQPHRTRLEIEVQSGDVIEIEGAEVEFSVTG